MSPSPHFSIMALLHMYDRICIELNMEYARSEDSNAKEIYKLHHGNLKGFNNHNPNKHAQLLATLAYDCTYNCVATLAFNTTILTVTTPKLTVMFDSPTWTESLIAGVKYLKSTHG